MVLCSGNYFDGSKKMHGYHLASALSAEVPVLYVDPPTSHLTGKRNPELASALRRPRLRRVGEQLAHLTPVAPPKPHSAAMVPLTERMVRASIRRAVAELRMEPKATITEWQLVDVFDACPGAKRVYWWTDDPGDASGLWGFDRDRLVDGDHRARARADLVVAVSEAVVGAVVDGGGAAEFFPNGCDPSTMLRTDLEQPAEDVRLPPPVAGFIGHLNLRTELALLEAVADTGLSLLLVGPCVDGFEPTRFAALCDRPNVQWVGAQPFERIPSYYRHMAVGLVPYGDIQFNRSSFPLKPLEYLAAGRPVVSTGLPGVRWLASPDITIADDPDAFAQATLAATELTLDESSVARRRHFAEQHSWSARADQLLQAVADG